MTGDAARKRAVRARMALTGEAFSVAARNVDAPRSSAAGQVLSMSEQALVDDARAWREVADLVIRLTNPPDQDMAEEAIIHEAIEGLAGFVKGQPCTCTRSLVGPDFEVEPCARCLALGLAADRPVVR